MIRRIKIRSHEIGLSFVEGEFRGLLRPGTHWIVDPLRRRRVEIVSRRAPWFTHEQLDVIVRSGALENQALVLDLKDHQRALVWIDGRFSHVMGPGLHAYWTTHREVRTEVLDVRQPRFEHAQLPVIVRSQLADRLLETHVVPPHHVGVLFVDGRQEAVLSPGQYAFWKNVAAVQVAPIELRETTQDIAGQELMTSDKVTLRLNAAITFRVVEAARAVSTSDNFRQALYREAQLALRSIVGGRELDAFLADKESVAEELARQLRQRTASLGLEIVSAGIRDIILPGDMKDLLNKVTEAKKAAEANLISRREETAAIRSQANTAKLLAESPLLMRLRELEVIEKIATASKLSVVLGDKSSGERGLTEKVLGLL